MLNVYIVRHGQTDTNKTLAINGSGTNLPLNETGIKQAEALRDSFDINKIDYVYASPLTRAKQTAEILNQNKHNIIYDDRLKEMILVIGTENLLQIFARNTHRPLMI